MNGMHCVLTEIEHQFVNHDAVEHGEIDKVLNAWLPDITLPLREPDGRNADLLCNIPDGISPLGALIAQPGPD